MVKRLLALFALLFPSVFAYSVPYVSVPLAVKDTVYFNNASDYAIYRVSLINPTNDSYYYYFQPISLGWQFIYPQGLFSIDPHQTITSVIKLRPYKPTAELPILSIIFEKGKNKTSYTLYFSPVVINEVQLEKVHAQTGLTFNAFLLKNETEIGSEDTIYITIDSFYPKPTPICVKINSSALEKKVSTCFTVESKKYFLGIPIKVSTAILPGKYPIFVTVDNKTKEVYISVARKSNVSVFSKDNNIIVKNNNDFVNTFTLKVEISPADKFFYIYRPAPDYELREGNRVYFVWNLVLLPNEKFVIHKEPNLLSIFLLILIFVLAVAYFVVSYYTPKLEITKEVLSIDRDKREIKMLISIKNKSAYKLRDVVVRDTILSIFKPVKFEFVEPVGFYEKGDKTVIKWLIDEILPGEERLLVYTVKYDTEVVGELQIDPVEVEITVWNKKHLTYSNSLILEFSQ